MERAKGSSLNREGVGQGDAWNPLPDACDGYAVDNVWVRAMALARPAQNPLWLAGVSGYPVRTAFCSFRCLCALVRAEAQVGREALERAGFRAAEVPARLGRTRPLVWFGARSYGISEGTSAEDAFALAATGSGCRLLVGTQKPTGGHWFDGLQVYRVVRLRQAIGPRRWRLARCLAEWAATRWLLPFPELCADGVIRWHALGRAAFDLASRSALLQEVSGERSRHEDLDLLRRDWQKRLHTGVGFLELAAGKMRTSFANRLRWAAEVLDAEAAQLAAQNDAMPAAGSTLITGHGALRTEGHDPARHHENELQSWDAAAQYLAEAAVLRARFAPSLTRALLEEPLNELQGTALYEVIYLARAGVNEFRALAARRLAGAAGSPAALATLEQLLYVRSQAVQLTAVAALVRHGIDGIRSLSKFIAEQAAHPSVDLDFASACALAAISCVDRLEAQEAASRILGVQDGEDGGLRRTKMVARAVASGSLATAEAWFSIGRG